MYRIVKWSQDQPTKRQSATDDLFADSALAEMVMVELQKALPHRCFAVEPVEKKETANALATRC
jgi:hypothetical protein